MFISWLPNFTVMFVSEGHGRDLIIRNPKPSSRRNRFPHKKPTPTQRHLKPSKRWGIKLWKYIRVKIWVPTLWFPNFPPNISMKILFYFHTDFPPPNMFIMNIFPSVMHCNFSVLWPHHNALSRFILTIARDPNFPQVKKNPQFYALKVLKVRTAKLDTVGNIFLKQDQNKRAPTTAENSSSIRVKSALFKGSRGFDSKRRRGSSVPPQTTRTPVFFRPSQPHCLPHLVHTDPLITSWPPMVWKWFDFIFCFQSHNPISPTKTMMNSEKFSSTFFSTTPRGIRPP